MNPATTYHRSSIEGTTPIGLVVLLFQGCTTALRRGIAAMEAGDIEARTHALNRVLGLVAELKAMLDYDRGGSVARQFAQFYQLSEQTILDASCHQDAERLRQLLEPFVRIQEAWQQVDALPAAAAERPLPRPNAAGEVRPAWQA